MVKTTRTKVIGTTRLLEPLNRGGMAEVFLGRQRSLEREVAVKIMLPDVADEDAAAIRFRREAQLLAGLQHENIVAVHDLVEKNEQLFMIMELVRGIDLADLLSTGGPLPLEVSLLIADAVVSALTHAHFRRVIHRDIKPANVMLSELGTVKLTDFGIAKDLDAEGITRTGLVVGSLAYAAPEQLDDQPLDERTDIYAVGVLLFECLTGRRPFEADSSHGLMAAIQRGRRPRIKKLGVRVPRSVEAIVDRCLQADPAKRWPSAAALGRRLEHVLERFAIDSPSERLVAFVAQRAQASHDSAGAQGESAALTVDEMAPTNAVQAETVAQQVSGDESDLTRPYPAGQQPDAIDASSTRPYEAEQMPRAVRRELAPGRSRHLCWLRWAAIVVTCLLVGVGLVWVLAPEATLSLLDQIGDLLTGR